MRSKKELDDSLTLVEIGRLIPHEEVMPELVGAIYRQMKADGFLAWPVVADLASGLILDGTHRYVAVRQLWRGQRVPVQGVHIFDRGIKLFTWCRVFAPIFPQQFDKIRQNAGLRKVSLSSPPGKREAVILFAGESYVFSSGESLQEQFLLLGKWEEEIKAQGSCQESFVTLEEARALAGQAGTLAMLPPHVTKEELVSLAGKATLPAKSTRFVFPFRLLGPRIPIKMLVEAGRPSQWNRWLGRLKAQPIFYLGKRITLDRFYPEEVYSYQDYIIPREFFLKEQDYQAYRARLIRRSNLIH